MNMERLYYDEKQKLLSELRKEIQEQEKQILDRISGRCRRFTELAEEAAWFAKAAGCNIRIQVLTDRSAMIRMQTDRIHFLSDGETDREEKEILQKLLQEAEYVHMGTDKREEKTVLLLEFGFDISHE